MAQENSDQSQTPESSQPEATRDTRKRIDRVTDWLCLGGALSPDEYPRFRDAGITHIVDLREDDEADAERLRELGLERRHVPVPDRGPPQFDQLTEAAQWFAAETSGASLYVHCKGGFGRAATMAVGLLILRGAALDEAVRQVREARPEMRLNNDQLDWLHAVEERIARETSEMK